MKDRARERGEVEKKKERNRGKEGGELNWGWRGGWS